MLALNSWNYDMHVPSCIEPDPQNPPFVGESPICEENNMSGNEWYGFLTQEQKFMQYIHESATTGHDIHATETNTDIFYDLPKSVADSTVGS
jgi:hypothetical protein